MTLYIFKTINETEHNPSLFLLHFSLFSIPKFLLKGNENPFVSLRGTQVVYAK